VGESGSPGGGRGVLEGAFLVLDALAQLQEAGLSALAAASGLPKATTHRLLAQLVELGAVEQLGARYRVGYRMLGVGHAWQPYPGLREAARGPLRGLTKATGASAAVCVLRTGRTVLVAGTRGRHASHPAVAPGSVLPWPTAAGKALVATNRSAGLLAAVASPASWARQSEAIRSSGIAVNLEQSAPDIRCLATPIRDAHGETVAALAIQATCANQARLTAALQRASVAIAASLPAASSVRPTARG
jgi:DNA-binding IclR family transcriptional regulator